MIVFSEINSFTKGQRDSFEELICVLAKCDGSESAYEYQANEGCTGQLIIPAGTSITCGRETPVQEHCFENNLSARPNKRGVGADTYVTIVPEGWRLAECWTLGS